MRGFNKSLFMSLRKLLNYLLSAIKVNALSVHWKQQKKNSKSMFIFPEKHFGKMKITAAVESDKPGCYLCQLRAGRIWANTLIL